MYNEILYSRHSVFSQLRSICDSFSVSNDCSISEKVYKMTQKHFMGIHTFLSDDTRRGYLTPPEDRKTEKEWAIDAIGEFATCMQTWCGNSEFFYCHWVAESEEAIFQQLEAFELDKIVSTMANEMHQFMSAYRNSDELRQYPQDGFEW